MYNSVLTATDVELPAFSHTQGVRQYKCKVFAKVLVVLTPMPAKPFEP